MTMRKFPAKENLISNHLFIRVNVELIQSSKEPCRTMISLSLMQARFKKSLYWPFICSSYICLSHCLNASDPGPLFPNGNYSVSTTRIVVHVFGSPISTDLGLSTLQRIRLSEPLLSSVSCHVIPKLPAPSNNAMCNCQGAFQIVIVLARKKYNAAISWF